MYNDRDIVHGLIKRDPHIISHFVDQYGQYIYALVFNVLGVKQTSEEATQDVMMKVIDKIELFDFSCKLKTWMYTIAKRTAIDYKRKVKYTDDIEHMYDMTDDCSSSDLIHSNENKRIVKALLSQLKPQDRELVELYYLNELSIKEIEEITELSASNIKVKLYRIRQSLLTLSEKYIDYEI